MYFIEEFNYYSIVSIRGVIMKNLYLDNGATSFPKAPGVSEAMCEYIDKIGANINRATYSNAKSAAHLVLDTRTQVAELVGYKGSETHVILTPGATFSLNTMIKGYLKAGDHAIVSSFEHNAVMRPLTELSKNGVEFSRIKADKNGISDMAHAESLFKENTKLAIINHASNVSGSIFPLKEFAVLCHNKGVKLVVDASQSLGHLKINFDELSLSGLAAPGHKGLLGPQGLGIMVLSEDFAKELDAIVLGGTGSFSESEEQVDMLPDKFESGTSNIPAIFGLHASLNYIKSIGIAKIREHDIKLSARFIEKLEGADVRILGGKSVDNRVGVVSVDFKNIDNAEAAYELESKYGIMTRVGLHCAPNAHKTLGSFPNGSVRFSFSIFNTESEIDYAAEAVKKIAQA